MNKYIYKSTKNLFKYLQNWCAHSTRLTECVAISLRYCLFVSAKSVYCQRHALVLFVRSVELSQSAKKFVNDKLHVIKPVPQLQCKVLLLLFFFRENQLCIKPREYKENKWRDHYGKYPHSCKKGEEYVLKLYCAVVCCFKQNNGICYSLNYFDLTDLYKFSIKIPNNMDDEFHIECFSWNKGVFHPYFCLDCICFIHLFGITLATIRFLIERNKQMPYC